MKYEQFNCALKFTQFTLENLWGIAGTCAGKNPVGYSFKNVLWVANSCVGIVQFRSISIFQPFSALVSNSVPGGPQLCTI